MCVQQSLRTFSCASHRSRQSEVFARAEEQVRSFSPNATRLAALFAQEFFCVQMKPCRPRTSNTFPDPSRASAPDHSLPRAGRTLQSLKSRRHRVTFQFDIPPLPPPPPPKSCQVPEFKSRTGRPMSCQCHHVAAAMASAMGKHLKEAP